MVVSIPLLDKALTSFLAPEIYDDTFDRVHYIVTTYIMGFLALMISAKQYIGTPIKCWTYKEFSNAWVEYAENYCFIQNTYYQPIHEALPEDFDARKDKEINYYQWVPFILAIQALLFYFPNLIWKYGHSRYGINFEKVIEDSVKLRTLRGKEKEDEEKLIVNSIYDSLQMAKRDGSIANNAIIRQECGYKITILYILIKIIYITNVATQIYAMNIFIGGRNHFWCIDLVRDMLEGRDNIGIKIFPRVTFCDFVIKSIGNDHPYTVQCVLMVNIFNEKIFMFLWLWFSIILVLSIINIFYNIWIYLPEKNRRTVAFRYMDYEKCIKKGTQFKIFCKDGLRADGILLLGFIECHAGTTIARLIMDNLYDKFFHEKPSEEFFPVRPPINDSMTKITDKGMAFVVEA
uniref:Innexin n=1 Tax=Parastrongyloides trichosuri TaxID=131310 RepID=A0A0N4ZD13_PARTI